MINGSHSYTLFYNQAALFVGDHPTHVKNLPQKVVKNKNQLFLFLEGWLNQDDPPDTLLVGDELEKMFKDVTNFFKYEYAAGGLVTNPKNQFLFIKRLGMWDLPKGKMEKNEKPKACALREVEEETGIADLVTIMRLPDTYHIYYQNDRFFLKKTYWYRMKTGWSQEPIPQTEEDITAAVWFDTPESREALSQSYRSLKDTLMPFLTL